MTLELFEPEPGRAVYLCWDPGRASAVTQVLVNKTLATRSLKQRRFEDSDTLLDMEQPRDSSSSARILLPFLTQTGTSVLFGCVLKC